MRPASLDPGVRSCPEDDVRHPGPRRLEEILYVPFPTDIPAIEARG